MIHKLKVQSPLKKQWFATLWRSNDKTELAKARSG